MPPKYNQIGLSIETIMDLSTLMIEDVLGRLQAVDDCVGTMAAAKMATRCC